jgi:drug/metabolite transporter superfamily protein YnfA
MRGTFNAIMRVVSSLIGLFMVAFGTIWILQGLNLAFRVGFMVGDRRWVLYGAILALVGIAQVIWSNTRQVSAVGAS